MCGKIARYNDARTASTEWINHMRRVHNKYNSYHSDAQVSLTLLLEANAHDSIHQDIDRYDPLTIFFRSRDWMNERGFLIPKEPDVRDS